MMRRWYDVLQVSPEADQEVIAAAFRALSKRCHPDVNKATDANRVMTEINRAYEVLSDPAARAEYDNLLSPQQDTWPGAQPAHDQRSEGPTLGAKFALIPSGTFMMGLRTAKPERFDYTLHQVTISKPFYMQTTPVTQVQWKRVMGMNVVEKRVMGIKVGMKVMENNPSYFKNCGDNCPVEQVWWNEAQEFIRKLNSMEGTDKYRLPTEAEWEYACRAGSTKAYCFGDDTKLLGEYAWYKENSGYSSHPVGQKKPNAWGLYDMHGNVWEWVGDWYGNYPSGSVTDPEGPRSGSCRIIRGGAWSVDASGCYSWFRMHPHADPGLYGQGIGYRGVGYLGFRLVRTR